MSIFTHWGLFKYRWIIAKEFLSLLSMVLGFVFIYLWTVAGSDMDKLSPVFKTNHLQLLIGIGVQILSLGAMYVISVFKPWGKRVQSKVE